MINFSGRHFKKDLIMMAIRWYVAYTLSYRDIEELMAERGIQVDHSTIHRWVVKDTSQLEEHFKKRYKRQPGTSWRLDETYIDKYGDTIDFTLSKYRDEEAVYTFLKKATGSSNVIPDKIVIDQSGANTAGIMMFNYLLFILGLWFLMIEIIQIKHLNNIIEQDHRPVKKKMKAALGFKSTQGAKATISGVEFYRMLKKKQMHCHQDKPAYEQFYLLAA
ncbi:transposase (plasmid) [Piscirickettsia salmonis]|uniref:IS6 family transposase n=1 Tax=Piscirickettsia salmonis TaxID=1238 RepID=UPI00094A6A45|nr:IS6 family transposase [Piscirickettsia salmonis]APS46012.1 transposase [Piscirickettsia salmonis]APS52314.1 transposase [Piscirickettsia salmonis]APS55628.1 transposase [Piscirickettsia salmonis]QGO82169.1 Transposase IS66 family protein [Piscirickettsia salmonis]QGP27424.1 Transposase IS66 family protein [Piscirickettsia salmonis]